MRYTRDQRQQAMDEYLESFVWVSTGKPKPKQEPKSAEQGEPTEDRDPPAED